MDISEFLNNLSDVFFSSGIVGIVEIWNGIIGIIDNFLFETNFLQYFQSGFSGNSIDNFNISGVLSTVHDVMFPIAVSLAMLFWFWGMFKQISNIAELKRPETIFKYLARFVFVLVLVNISDKLVCYIWNLGASLLTEVNRITNTTGVPGEIAIDYASIDAMSNTDTGNSALNMLTGITAVLVAGFVGLLILAILIVSVVVMCKNGLSIFIGIFKRFFIMAIYVVCAPLAMSTAAYEGTQRTAIMFWKNVVATSIELSMTALMLKLFSIMTNFFLQNVSLDVTPFYAIPGVNMVPQLAPMLEVTLLILILGTSIKSLNSILDSMFGLHGV